MTGTISFMDKRSTLGFVPILNKIQIGSLELEIQPILPFLFLYAHDQWMEA